MTLRAVLRVLAMALLLGVCLPACAIGRLLGGGSFWVSLFLRGTGRILGLRVRSEGAPLRQSVLYAANHISWLDILALGGAVPTRFIAKSEIERWPLIGWLAGFSGSVFVSRERRSATRAQADAVATALGEGQPVSLFAEGGTGDGVRLDPFRASLFAGAIEAGTMVQPVAIDYGARSAEIAWPDGERFSVEIKRMLNRRGAVPVTLRFLAPLDARAGNRKVLAERSFDAVAVALGQKIPAEA